MRAYVERHCPPFNAAMTKRNSVGNKCSGIRASSRACHFDRDNGFAFTALAHFLLTARSSFSMPLTMRGVSISEARMAFGLKS